jgi:sugar phosphate permease
MNRRIHYAWVILAVFFITIFTTYSIRLGYGVIMPAMIGSLAITKTEAGAIASSFFLVYTLFGPVAGFLIDRFHPRKVLAIFCAVQGVGTLLMGIPETLAEACVYFSLAGAGSSAMWNAAITLVQRWFGGRRRGLALGLLSTSYAIGYGLMGLMIPMIVDRHGWRTCWLILGALALGLVPLNGLLLRTRPQEMGLQPWGESPDPSAAVPPEAIAPMGYRDLLKIPNLWWICVSYFFIGLTAYMVNTFIVTYGNIELQFSYARAARLASAVAFSGLAGAFLLPFLSEYFGRKRCVLLVNGSMAASIVVIILAGSNWTALFAGACIFGVFYAAAWPM